MKHVPLYVIEEHHEAFLLWHHAIREGLLPRRGNHLLHIDEHADLRVPQMDTSLHDLDGDLDTVVDVTYHELNIVSFIAPALYKGIFDTLDWLQAGRRESALDDLAVYSHRAEGKLLFLNRAERIEGETRRRDAHPFRYRELTLGSDVERPDAVALDVDLDFFLCSPTEPVRAVIEVTRREYEAWRQDRYHPLRIAPGTHCRFFAKDGAFFVDFSPRFPRETVEPWRAGGAERQIDERVGAFREFLVRNRVSPSLVTLCRSRLSGYTPADYWELIEERVIAVLSELYDTRSRHVGEMFSFPAQREVRHGDSHGA